MTTLRQPLVLMVWGIAILLGVAAGVAVHRLWDLRNEIERLADRLTLEVGPESTLVYDANDSVVSALFEEHRIAVALEDISAHLIDAVLVTEDRRFYDHHGVDIPRIVKAAIANTRAGDIVQGGSTITQQLVRSIVLDREQSYSRKFKEAMLARRLEERYSKRAILEAYLNRVYFGDGYYGVEAASLGYFGKRAASLEPVEAAMLAGLIKGPSLYSPSQAPELARHRRDVVLWMMRDEGALSESAYQQAVSIPVDVMLTGGQQRRPDPRRTRGGEYFASAVGRELIERFGADLVYTGGLRVYTTLDRRLQALAEETVSTQIERLTRAKGDSLEGALVTIEPRTGHVKAIVGGHDFRETPFNRALEAYRQPGSAFKPFIFAVALESGYTLSSWLDGLDEPIPTRQGPWLPGGEHEQTSVRLRDALVLSSNRAAAHLLQEVGLRRTVDLVQRLGVSSSMPYVPSLALGTGEMTLFELTSAYGTFANRGVWREPTMIRRVVDRHGTEIYRAPGVERAVISEATAYLMSSMLADVIDHGTATGARKAGFRRKAAGKTGTSQSYADAWFVGYTPQLVTGVWFGYDAPQTIMKRGFANVVAVPAWARFMEAALEGTESEWFERPESLVPVRLCRLSGNLATHRCDEPVIELPDYAEEHPNWYAPPIIRKGGTYTELRHVGRRPPTCILPHGEDLPVATPASAAVEPQERSEDKPAGAAVIMSGAPAVVPASMLPQSRPVLTVTPGATAQPEIEPPPSRPPGTVPRP